MKQKILIAVIAVIVIVGGAYWYMSRNKVSAPETNSNTNQNSTEGEFTGDVPNDSTTENPTIPTSDTIAVSTQIAGDSVTVDNAFLEKAGYISIHEVDAKGKAGAVIGVSGLLGTGAKQDLEIKAPIKSGSKYMAILRADNGDKKFDVTKDLAVVKGSGNVMTMFSVSQ